MSAATAYRAEPVGSLLRPDYLKEARAAHGSSERSPAELKAAEDRAVADAIAMQEAAGLDVVTDGELRRAHFTAPLAQILTGVELVEGAPATGYRWKGYDDVDGEFMATGAVATQRLGRTSRSLVQEELVFARAQASKPVKVTLPSPLVMNPVWSRELSSAAYGDAFELFEDMAGILREEVERLVELGCEYIQIDAPELTHLVDDSLRDDLAERGIDPERIATDGIEIINGVASVQGPRYALHLCRGNRKGRWVAEGGYEAISRELFRRATSFDAFFLEYDDERSGGFEPLADVPEGKTVVLGLVSTKRPEVERADDLLARIEAATRHLPREQLALSTQCGFSSAGPDAAVVTPEVQQRKLALVGELAATVWSGH